MSTVSVAAFNDAINDALREAYNLAGDMAFFLRRTMDVAIAYPPETTTLSVAVRRLYKLERITLPGQFIDWTLIQHSSTGQMVISAAEGGTFRAHYIDYPEDLLTDDDEAEIPWQHAELVVVAACRRLAESVGNPVVAQSLAREYAVLSKVFKRDCLRYDGQRHEPLTTTASRSTWAAGPQFQWNP